MQKIEYMEYPRPQLRRNKFYKLDGEWSCCNRKIMVPFPPQGALSGFEGDIPEKFTYEKEFLIPKHFTEDRIILHFGAVDQCCQVKINGIEVGGHKGGYTAFSLDITSAVKRDEKNLIEVCVEDTLSLDYPYGKQTKKPEGMWYTPVSGIWQSVWLENVPDNYIKRLVITPFIDRVIIEPIGYKSFENVEVDIKLPDGTVLTHKIAGAEDEIIIPKPVNWTVTNPYLYHFIVRADEDVVESYFALRTISINNIDGINRVCLNGKPIFMHGVLDQGYFKDGIYLPENSEGYVQDIVNMKKLGFNMLRKHIKVEPEQFYYACDALGMLVMQDMVNSGEYSFFRDTFLPTIGFNRRRTTKLSDNHPRRVIFENMMKEIVEQLYNHPSVVAYTIFNEGWGQFNTDDMYEYLKSLDDTRLIDSASGWFVDSKTDFDSPHIYFRNVRLKPKSKPMLLSECGGYKYMIKDHYFWHKEYGYGSCKDSEDLTKRIEKMYELMVIPAIKKGLCGCVYTQLSDVEGEINGIYTYDRAVCKVNTDVMKQIADKIMAQI